MRHRGGGILRESIAVLLFLFSVVCIDQVHAARAEQKTYIFAVLPQQPPLAMHTLWTPLVERLSRDTGIRFKLKLYDRMNIFEQDALKGLPDFIFTTPPMTVIAHLDQGYTPLVRSSHPISGVLFTSKDSPIHSVAELEQKDIAFVGSRNVCSILVRDNLHRLLSHQIAFNTVYEGSTANVIKHVLLGKAQAGATLDLDLEKDADVLSQMKILLKTEKIPPHPISAHPRVPQKVAAQVADAILKMNEDAAGRSLLARVRLSDPVKSVYRQDYGHLEKVDVKGLSREK